MVSLSHDLLVLAATSPVEEIRKAISEGRETQDKVSIHSGICNCAKLSGEECEGQRSNCVADHIIKVVCAQDETCLFGIGRILHHGDAWSKVGS